MFYRSVVGGELFFAEVCWGSSIGASDTNRFNEFVLKAGSIFGGKLDSFEAVVERGT